VILLSIDEVTSLHVRVGLCQSEIRNSTTSILKLLSSAIFGMQGEHTVLVLPVVVKSLDTSTEMQNSS
jgi:hypothetical protein